MTPFHRLHQLRMENDEAGYRQEEMRGRFDALRNRHETGNAPRPVSSFQLFQTPADLAQRLVSLLHLQPGARVLEPSAGLGRILDCLDPLQPSEIVAVEVAAPCAGELFRQDRPRTIIKQRDFLSLTPADLGLFDAIAMNPPFHMRSDIRHILHARQFLKPGGTIAAICMAGRHRDEQLKPIASTWEELPASTFRKEGTSVATILLTINHPCPTSSPCSTP